MTLNQLIERYWIEDLKKTILNLLKSERTEKEKLIIIGSYFRPRLDYIKADILIKCYMKEQRSKEWQRKK